MIDKKLLYDKALELGITLDEKQLDQFDLYARALVEYNQKINLTTITEPTEIVIKHFVDSLALSVYYTFPQNATLADVGTGAGFPSIPLKILRKDLSLTLLDSLAKRVVFLEQISKTLGQKNKSLHIRAEQAGIEPKLRGQYDVVTARAVAQLRVLCELCLPLVKLGGVMIAMKGPGCADEVENAKDAIELLGGALVEAKEYTLCGTEGRTLIIIKKIGETPPKYPRQRVKISDKPL